MQVDLLIPTLRQFLQIVGGALLAHGYLDENSIGALTGVIINGVTFLWWFHDHHRSNGQNTQ